MSAVAIILHRHSIADVDVFDWISLFFLFVKTITSKHDETWGEALYNNFGWIWILGTHFPFWGSQPPKRVVSNILQNVNKAEVGMAVGN